MLASVSSDSNRKNSSQLLNSTVIDTALICSMTKMKQSIVAYTCQGGEKRGIEAENNYPPHDQTYLWC